jgi:AraC-like DNA-binding protein
MNRLIATGYSKNTAEVDERSRFDFWRDIICDEFVQLDCEPVRDGPFEGELRGGAQVGGVRFAEVESDPQLVVRSRHQIARAREEDFLISFQLRDTGIVRQDGREAVLAPGSFALYDSTRPYTLHFANRFHQLVVQMPKQVLSRHLINPEQYTAIAIAGDHGLGAILANFVLSLASELHTVRDASEELADNLVNMIAMAFSSSVQLRQVSDSTVLKESLRRRVRQYIANNLCDPALSNAAIARAQGISPRYLHKLFEGEEQSVHHLIIDRRLALAESMLRDPAHARHSIEQIAWLAGFTSNSHFSRAFKARYGISPGAVRSAH